MERDGGGFQGEAVCCRLDGAAEKGRVEECVGYRNEEAGRNSHTRCEETGTGGDRAQDPAIRPEHVHAAVFERNQARFAVSRTGSCFFDTTHCLGFMCFRWANSIFIAIPNPTS